MGFALDSATALIASSCRNMRQARDNGLWYGPCAILHGSGRAHRDTRSVRRNFKSDYAGNTFMPLINRVVDVWLVQRITVSRDCPASVRFLEVAVLILQLRLRAKGSNGYVIQGRPYHAPCVGSGSSSSYHPGSLATLITSLGQRRDRIAPNRAWFLGPYYYPDDAHALA